MAGYFIELIQIFLILKTEIYHKLLKYTEIKYAEKDNETQKGEKRCNIKIICKLTSKFEDLSSHFGILDLSFM